MNHIAADVNKVKEASRGLGNFPRPLREPATLVKFEAANMHTGCPIKAVEGLGHCIQPGLSNHPRLCYYYALLERPTSGRSGGKSTLEGFPLRGIATHHYKASFAFPRHSTDYIPYPDCPEHT